MPVPTENKMAIKSWAKAIHIYSEYEKKNFALIRLNVNKWLEIVWCFCFYWKTLLILCNYSFYSSLFSALSCSACGTPLEKSKGEKRVASSLARSLSKSHQFRSVRESEKQHWAHGVEVFLSIHHNQKNMHFVFAAAPSCALNTIFMKIKPWTVVVMR